eukprot:TRINITY_DN56065_c0_g1_i1.p1 TRINITY_DN56065_c0_g1~~TRINITY_DN56065_c0_g1_i1.p1  ORF type:complete len:376 (-),score=52.93 TRINITY_DN56065_c0_g1_i1:325-1452(-)
MTPSVPPPEVVDNHELLALAIRGRSPQKGEITPEHADDVALMRRGKHLIKAVNQSLLIYNRTEWKDWNSKYVRFSNKHMPESAFKIFTRAQHDPLNKQPRWATNLLANIGLNSKNNGVTLPQLFDAADMVSDGLLGREEMRQILLGIDCTLSDAELTYVFDEITKGKKEYINRAEFIGAVEAAMSKRVEEPGDVAHNHRSPIHGVRVYPPGIGAHSYHLLEDSEVNDVSAPSDCEIDDRLRALLARSPHARRALQARKAPTRANASKYQYFSGGGDAERFQRANRRRTRPNCVAEAASTTAGGVSCPVSTAASGAAAGGVALNATDVALTHIPRPASRGSPTQLTPLPERPLRQRWVWDTWKHKKVLIKTAASDS